MMNGGLKDVFEDPNKLDQLMEKSKTHKLQEVNKSIKMEERRSEV